MIGIINEIEIKKERAIYYIREIETKEIYKVNITPPTLKLLEIEDIHNFLQHLNLKVEFHEKIIRNKKYCYIQDFIKND